MSGRVWFWNREGADTDLYSFTGWRWVMVVAALLGLVWSSIIPPMKAWDEADHTRRAWFLVDGQWMLRSQSCFEEGPECRNGRTMSGGDINAGLQRYIEIWERQNGAQLTQTRPVENTARSVRWDAEHVFAGAPGTAYYFPLIYTPQAVGLALGRLLRLKVQHSYYLARFVTLASTILVLALSFAIFAPTPITLALLMLPMSLFQAVSAGLDPFSSALAILALSCFMRLMVNRAAPDVTLYVLMCASVFLVATSRAHLITMLLFLFVTAWKTGKRYFWFGAMLTTVAIAWWMWMAIPSAVDFRLQRAHSTGQIVQLYLSNPGELLSVLYRNFSDANALQGYWRSFIGGFMGVWVPVFVPVVLTIVFLILLVVNATGAVVRDNILVRSTLLVTGVGSAFLAVLAMLLTWNDYPVPSIIEGVQGRYFLVPAILAFMAISCWSKPSEKCRKTSAALLAVFFVFGYTVTTRLLVDAFYVPWSAQPRPVTGEDRVNGPFGSGRPVVIRFERLAETIANDVNQIGILTATYGRKLEGTGRAVFHASNGKTVFLDFPLSDFKDGRYIYFDLPSASWTNAELHVLSGEGGGSVWEYRPFSSGDSPAAWQACVVLKNANGTRQVTEGCRKP